MNTDALPPFPSDPTVLNSTHHPVDNSFPIIAIAVIGILATGFLLISYYVFVIKCCLNWHCVGILRRFSTSQTRHIPNFTSTPTRGLDESTIRTIPILSFKNSGYKDRSFRECAVCLSEFQDEEKLRFIPNCNHMFHIDCIDVWLQNNANCPLCRTSICGTPNHSISNTQPLSPLFGNPTLYHENFTGNDDDYVIIDLPGRHSVSMDQSLLNPKTERSIATSSTQHSFTELPALKLEQRRGFRTHLVNNVASKGDECIDIRANEDKFEVQPIRRSFSMGSSDDQQLYLMVQEIMKHQRGNVASDHSVIFHDAGSEGCSNGSKLRRSFFSFGSGRGSKSSVLPIHRLPS